MFLMHVLAWCNQKHLNLDLFISLKCFFVFFYLIHFQDPHRSAVSMEIQLYHYVTFSPLTFTLSSHHTAELIYLQLLNF